MKVLVVEDYVPIRKAVEATLREFGYAVDCAVDGVEGLLALAKKRMAFVIISALLLSVAVLWPITGIVLRPANAIAERISSLSVSDLSSRIDTTNCPTELQAIPLRRP